MASGSRCTYGDGSRARPKPHQKPFPVDESSNELLQLRRKTQSLVPAWQQMATRGYGGEHVPSAMALMGMPAESERQRAHTAEVAYGQRQQLQDEEAMAMEQAFLSEGARADAAERHAAEMRDVVHALKDHVLKEQASSSTRPVGQHRPESAQSCKGRGCTSSRPQKAAGAASRKAWSYLGRSDSTPRYTTSHVWSAECFVASLSGGRMLQKLLLCLLRSLWDGAW